MNAPQGPVRGPVALLPTRVDVRALLTLAIPVVTVQVGLMAMGAVDTIMLGRVSPTHLAGGALGNYYFSNLIAFGMGCLMALDPIVAQAVGAKDHIAIARAAQRGVLLAVALSLLTMAFLLPAGPILRALRQPAEVIPIATAYVHVTALGALPFLLFVVLRQTLQAIGRLAPIVWTIIIANVANALLNYALVFGHWGAEPGGAVGAAWASTISRWLMVLVLGTLAWKGLRTCLIPLRPEALEGAPLRRMLRLGVPVGFQLMAEFGVFGLTGILMGIMGTIPLAAHQLAINLASLTFMVPLGIAQASSVLVGRAVGSGTPERARRAAGAGLGTATAFMTLSAITFLTIPELLARAYTTDMTVLALAATLIPIAGIFQVFDGLQVAAAGILRGIGDTKVPMLVNILGFWLLGVPVMLFLGFATEMGPAGLWWGLAAGLAVVAAFLLARVAVLLSRELNRLVIDEVAPERPEAPGIQ